MFSACFSARLLDLFSSCFSHFLYSYGSLVPIAFFSFLPLSFLLRCVIIWSVSLFLHVFAVSNLMSCFALRIRGKDATIWIFTFILIYFYFIFYSSSLLNICLICLEVHSTLICNQPVFLFGCVLSCRRVSLLSSCLVWYRDQKLAMFLDLSVEVSAFTV